MKHILLSVLLLASPLLAADEVSYYKGGEFNLSLFGSVNTTDFDNERGSVGLGADLFLSENIGIGVSTAIEDMNGSTIDNVSVRVLYRIPVKQNAIYGFAGGKRLLNEGAWSGLIGMGVERRWAKHFGTFLEWGGEKQLTGSRDVSAFGTAGVRLNF